MPIAEEIPEHVFEEHSRLIAEDQLPRVILEQDLEESSQLAGEDKIVRADEAEERAPSGFPSAPPALQGGAGGVEAGMQLVVLALPPEKQRAGRPEASQTSPAVKKDRTTLVTNAVGKITLSTPEWDVDDDVPAEAWNALGLRKVIVDQGLDIPDQPDGSSKEEVLEMLAAGLLRVRRGDGEELCLTSED